MSATAALYAAQGGLQLWSSYQQASMMDRQNQMQQNINELNAEFAELDAWRAERHGYTQAARYQTVVDKKMGKQKAAFAAGDVDPTFGTAASIQEEDRLTTYLNALDIKKAARYKARGLRVEASNIRLQGFMSGLQSEMQQSATMRRGVIGATGSAARSYGAMDNAG